MDVAKSLLERSHGDGYKGDHLKIKSQLETSNDDFISDRVESFAFKETHVPGTPFSAIIKSMWPKEIINNLEEESRDPNDQPDYRFDEFGFRVEEEDGPEPMSKKSLVPFVEDEEKRLKWITYLKFSTDINTVPRTNKLRSMVREGIAHDLRAEMWLRLSGALQKKMTADTTYEEILKEANNDSLMTSKQIEKDLLRIIPTNSCFGTINGTGVSRLKRILRCIAWQYPDIGYCQGMGVIVACLLLFMEEENAFWMMVTVIEDLLPASYYSSTLLGVQADQKVLQTLISNYLPEINEVLNNHDIEISLITLQWFLTLFANVVHMKILLRIWDWLFYDGSIVLFQLAIALLKNKETQLTQLENAAEIFNALSAIPVEIEDVDKLFQIAIDVGGSVNVTMIQTYRRRSLAYLMADQGSLVGNLANDPNLPKQTITKRHIKKSKSMYDYLFKGDNDTDDLKSKNIKQTELLVDLRESVLKVARHFMTIEPKLSNIVKLTADYSIESHSKDHETYIDVSRSRKKRAKALHDFERHDDDELGFRKNDIIIILSQKDEHCWVGELNGLKGWFPAKFVEILDERSKKYSLAGDDTISETVQDLIRGTLSPPIKHIFEHGMKRPTFMGGTCHPWLFVEEAADREIQKDFNSVYSRLILCKTYRLDEDGKVLTPEELLYRSVQAINQSHANTQMDVKLRSLICLGLNEQVLHLWMEVLCSCTDVVQKWYHPWSFICSPGWVQIKCELRILNQFSFNLSPDWELPRKDENNVPGIKDGVRDMLIKHHLFSWDL